MTALGLFTVVFVVIGILLWWLWSGHDTDDDGETDGKGAIDANDYPDDDQDIPFSGMP